MDVSFEAADAPRRAPVDEYDVDPADLTWDAITSTESVPWLPEISERRTAVDESYLAQLIEFLNVRTTLPLDDEEPDELPDRQDPAAEVEIELALAAAAVLVGDLGDPNVFNVMVAAAALVMSLPVSAVTAAFMAMKLLSGAPH